MFKDKLPEEWMFSSLVPFFKGKGDPLNPNTCQEIKVSEHAFKLYEKSLDGRLTADAVFVLRRLTEKVSAKSKKFFIFVGLEKAFDRVPREVIRFALRWKGVHQSWCPSRVCFESSFMVLLESYLSW